MSTEASTTEDPTIEAVSEVEATEADEPTTEPEPTDKADNEAAKYRRKLRETERDRDQVSTQLAAARATIVTQMLEQSPVTMDALTSAGYDVSTLLADDGTVDPNKVTAAADDTQRRFNITRNVPRSDALSRVGSGALVEPQRSWADALQGGNNR